MTDKFTPEQRSRIMSRVRGHDTEPEMSVRSLLHKMGYRFRLHVKGLPGQPDIVLPRYKKVIFVHGCFWHGHKGCKRSSRPVSNETFWNRKIDGNIKRDDHSLRTLRSLGWMVMVVWQCQIHNTEKLHQRLERFIQSGKEKEL